MASSSPIISFDGSWQSRYYGSSTIFGTSKVEFMDDPTNVKLILNYDNQSLFRPGLSIEFNFKLSRNDRFCYAQSVDQTQQVFLIIDLKQDPFVGRYLSIWPYDDGHIHMNDNQMCDFIFKNIPDTQATKPPEFNRNRKFGYYCCDII